MNLKLATKKLFEGFEIKCYEDISRENGDFFMTRKQISEALGYIDTKSFDKVIERKRGKVGNPVHDKLSATDGKQYDTELYSFEQFFELIDGNRQPKAQLFRKWAVLTLKELVTGRAELQFKNEEDQQVYEDKIAEIVNNAIKPLHKEITELKNTFIFKQYTNPTHKFEALLTQFAIFYNFDGSERYRKLYNALDNWMGIKLPRGRKFSTKEYILQNIDISIIECFVNGIIQKRIIKNKHGNYVDLNGVFANPVELDKIKNEFDNECAYCGASGITLIAEHILPKRHEKSTDLIHNIVPSCLECNQSKGENVLKEWYKKQDFCTKKRIEKITKHWKEYRVYLID